MNKGIIRLTSGILALLLLASCYPGAAGRINYTNTPSYKYDYGNKIVASKTYGTFSKSVEACGSDYPGVTFSVKELKLNTLSPSITIEWHNFTNERFTYKDSAAVYYGYQLENRATKKTGLSGKEYHIAPNSTMTHTYSLKGFDLSEKGLYRFETGENNEFWIDFRTDKVSYQADRKNIDYECEAVDIGYGSNEADKILKSLYSGAKYEYGKPNEALYISVSSKERLDEVSKSLGDAFDLKKGYNDVIEKFDDAFFENKRLVMIAFREKSDSIQHHISGFKITLHESDLTVNRFIPEKCSDTGTTKLLLFSWDKKAKGNSGFHVYSSDVYHDGSGNIPIYDRFKPINKPIYVEGVNSTVTSVDLNSENPTIHIYWTYYGGDRITVGKEFDIQRFEDGKWVSCAGRGVKFEDGVFSVQHNALRYDYTGINGASVSYSLKGFDISESGTYRFIPPISEKEYYEFDVIKYPKFNSIDFETKDIDIGWGDDEGRAALASIRESGSSESYPLVRIESVDKLNKVYGIMNERFNTKKMQEAFNDCDEQFFENKTIFFIYVSHGCIGYDDTVKGVEYDKKGKLSICIECDPPEICLDAMSGNAVAIIVDKKMADKFKAFDVTVYILSGDTVVIQ